MSKMSFYRPHARVTFGNELVDPVTGEVSYPESMTKQAHLKECDINTILKQFSVTGMLRHVSAQQGMYVNLPEPIDFQAANNLIIEAANAFNALPSKVRDRFGEDPEKFLAFMSDPANKAEAIALGLHPADPPPPSPPPVDPPADPPQPKERLLP